MYQTVWIAHYATTNDYANLLTIPEQCFKILLYLSAGPRLQSMALFAEISGAESPSSSFSGAQNHFRCGEMFSSKAQVHFGCGALRCRR